MKKAIALGITVVILLTTCILVFQFTASGKSTQVVADVSKSVISPGETIEQKVSFENFTNITGGIRSFKLVVNYDSEKLENPQMSYQGVLESECLVSFQTGNIIILYADSENGLSPALAGDVFKITYTAKTNAYSGNAEFAINADSSSYIDCSFLRNPTTEQAKARYVTPDLSSEIISVYLNAAKVSSDHYTINNAVISAIEVKTNTTNFLAKLKIEPNTAKVEILDSEGKNLNDTNYSGNYLYVGTGMTINIYDGNFLAYTYNTLIKGDITGDGERNVLDLVAVKNHLLSKHTLSEFKEKAADYNNDQTIKLVDLLDLKAVITANL